MVFRKEAPPKTRKEFMRWYSNQVESNVDGDYDDPAVTSEELRNWYMEMIETFPPMSGPYMNEDDDSPNVTEYNMRNDSIYMSFAWSVADEALRTVLKLAEKHGVGFFNVSDDKGGILFPENGKLISIKEFHKIQSGADSNKESKPWWKSIFGS